MAATKKKNAKKAAKQEHLHDEGYKAILSKVSNFLHLLRKYFHAPWVANLIESNVVLFNKSYISKEYRRMDSDIIYKVWTGTAHVYFYILLELQSRVDYTMPFRLLRYMVELLNDDFKNTPKKIRERKGFKLPAVVPIVLYDGKSPWTAAASFKEYTQDADIFGNCIIDFKYPVLDLNQLPYEEILPTRTLLDAVFSLAKMRLDNKLSMEGMAAWLAEQAPHLSKEDISQLSDWLTHAFKAPPEINKLFDDTIKKGETIGMKTGFEIWADEYREGCELKGRREEDIRIARAMKADDMDVYTISRLTGLTIDEIILL